MPYLKPDDRLLVIIGPSGTGKTNVLNLLHDQRVVEVNPTWTTRPPRPDETNEILEHRFIDEATLTQKAEAGEFLEILQPFNLSYRYGLPKIERSDGSRVATIVLRGSLLPVMDKHYTNYMVYQIEDTPEKTAERLKKRQAAGLDIGSRLDEYQSEIEAGRARAHRVFTNDGTLDELAGKVAAALIEDRLVGPEN